MKINKEEMEKSLFFLAETDEQYARARALHDGLCNQRPVLRSQLFMRSTEKSATAREHQAQTSDAYLQHLAKIDMANLDVLTLQAKRSTAQVVIDCWRSLNSARNKGQII